MIFFLKDFIKRFSRFISITILGVTLGLNVSIRGGLTINKVWAAESPSKPKQQNVLLLLSDDHGLQVGCYGNPVIQTPNIDSLAKNGVRFTNAFATVASCSAARSVIYTGLFNHTNGQYGHAHYPYCQHTHDWVRSLPFILNEMGYHTGIIGKVHVNPIEVYPFDEYISYGRGDGFTLYRKTKEFLDSQPDKPFLFVVGFIDPHRTGPGKFGELEAYPGEKKVTYSPENVIVPPWLPDVPGARKELARYYRSITRMDQNIGQVLKALKETGRDKETLIIYTSDGGPPFPGAKTNLYEPAIRVPFIISAPNLKSRGMINKAMISYIDILPTILDWAGFDSPRKIKSNGYMRPPQLGLLGEDFTYAGTGASREEKGKGVYILPGHSLLPILEEENPEGWDVIYASHTFHEITMYYPMRAIRTRKFKYIVNFAHKLDYPFATDLYTSLTWQDILEHDMREMGVKSVESYLHRPKEELYNIEKDPFEANNLVKDPMYKDVLEDLRNQIISFQNSTDDIWLLKWKYE